MKVLVVGNGGREHALCTFIHKSPICSKLFCIPGSDSIQQIAECFKIDSMNNKDVLFFCKKAFRRAQSIVRAMCNISSIFRGNWAIYRLIIIRNQ